MKQKEKRFFNNQRIGKSRIKKKHKDKQKKGKHKQEQEQQDEIEIAYVDIVKKQSNSETMTDQNSPSLVSKLNSQTPTIVKKIIASIRVQNLTLQVSKTLQNKSKTIQNKQKASQKSNQQIQSSLKSQLLLLKSQIHKHKKQLGIILHKNILCIEDGYDKQFNVLTSKTWFLKILRSIKVLNIIDIKMSTSIRICLLMISHIKFPNLTHITITSPIQSLEPLTWLNSQKIKFISILQTQVTTLKGLNKLNQNLIYLRILSDKVPTVKLNRIRQKMGSNLYIVQTLEAFQYRNRHQLKQKIVLQDISELIKSQTMQYGYARYWKFYHNRIPQDKVVNILRGVKMSKQNYPEFQDEDQYQW